MTRLPAPVRSLLRPVAVALDLAVALLVGAAALPLAFLPWRAAGAAGRVLGTLALLAWPLGRRKALVNLRRAYGAAMPRKEAARIARRGLASLGQGVAEGLQLARRLAFDADAWRPLVVAEDPALEARLLGAPGPMILVTGHLGSWEVAIAVAGRLFPGGAVVARRIENGFLEALVTRLRGGRGTVIEKAGAVEEALARLREGRGVALLLDENAGHRGLFVPFFGRLASTSKTAALLSIRTGAPIVVGAAVRRPGPCPFLYRLAPLPPPPADRKATPDDVRELTAAIAATLERWIREDPEQWRWVHHRWKTRPDGTEETYRRRDVARAFSGEEEP